jgi:hypothetical protein
VLTLIARGGQRVADLVPGAMAFEIAWTRDGARDGREDLTGLVRAGSTWSAPTPAGGI